MHMSVLDGLDATVQQRLMQVCESIFEGGEADAETAASSAPFSSPMPASVTRSRGSATPLSRSKGRRSTPMMARYTSPSTAQKLERENESLKQELVGRLIWCGCHY